MEIFRNLSFILIFGMGERTGGEVYLNEAVNVDHQSLGPADDKLVHTGNGMRPVRKQNTL